ncbi:hypothetical protein SDJN03_13264, partial [Cucurbita argyrosperma subsp. sororia]
MARLKEHYFSTSLTSTKSRACFFLFLLLLPYNFSTLPSSASASTPSRPPSSSLAMEEQAFSSPYSSQRTLQQFEAAMHEVPSGPNPTTNK